MPQKACRLLRSLGHVLSCCKLNIFPSGLNNKSWIKFSNQARQSLHLNLHHMRGATEVVEAGEFALANCYCFLSGPACHFLLKLFFAGCISRNEGCVQYNEYMALDLSACMVRVGTDLIRLVLQASSSNDLSPKLDAALRYPTKQHSAGLGTPL